MIPSMCLPDLYLVRQQVAASHGNLRIAKLLLDNGADIEARDRWGSTAIHEAKRSGARDVALRLELELAKKRLRSGSSGASSPAHR